MENNVFRICMVRTASTIKMAQCDGFADRYMGDCYGRYGCRVLSVSPELFIKHIANNANIVLITFLLKRQILLTIAIQIAVYVGTILTHLKIHLQLLKKSFDVFFNFDSIICSLVISR